MARRKIIWSLRSEIDLYQILEFYGKRNGNYNYSKSIYTRIRRSVLVLKQFPGIGAQTDIEKYKEPNFRRFQRILQNQ